MSTAGGEKSIYLKRPYSPMCSARTKNSTLAIKVALHSSYLPYLGHEKALSDTIGYLKIGKTYGVFTPCNAVAVNSDLSYFTDGKALEVIRAPWSCRPGRIA